MGALDAHGGLVRARRYVDGRAGPATRGLGPARRRPGLGLVRRRQAWLPGPADRQWLGRRLRIDRNPGLSASRPFVNSDSFGSGSTSDGRWLLKYGTSFDLIAKVARVDIRLTWPCGASQWEHAAVRSANGYAEVTAIGTGPKPADRDVRVEVRLTDASGHVFARLAGTTGAPPSVVR
jgi:hypothetical protein